MLQTGKTGTRTGSFRSQLSGGICSAGLIKVGAKCFSYHLIRRNGFRSAESYCGNKSYTSSLFSADVLEGCGACCGCKFYLTGMLSFAADIKLCGMFCTLVLRIRTKNAFSND